MCTVHSFPLPWGWDVCWPIVLRTHVIRLTLVFFHGVSPIKESIVTRLCMVLFCIGRETAKHEEEVQWICCRLYPFIFMDCNKKNGNFFVDVAHRLGEPHYIYVSL